MPVRDYIESIAAGWLKAPGLALLGGLTGAMDSLAERTRLSARAALLELAEDDALGAHGRMARLERVRGEGPVSFRSWLRSKPQRYRDAGTMAELQLQLRRLGYRATIVTWLDLALAGNPGAFGGKSTYFYVRIDLPHPFTAPIRWDAAGATWDGGALWDLRGPPEALEDLKRTIRRWRPAVMSCRYIEIALPAVPPRLPELVRVPMYEPWQLRGGAGVDDYNQGY